MTGVCLLFELTGTCQYGDACLFEHTPSSGGTVHPNSLQQRVMLGCVADRAACGFRNACRFQHSASAAAAAPRPLSVLELDMRAHQYAVELTPREYQDRVVVRNNVSRAAQGVGGVAHLFGSSANGCGTRTSDVDVCLALQEPMSKNANKKTLRSIGTELQRSRLGRNFNYILGAKVPIIKYIDTATNLNVDLSLGNVLAVYNTNLLRTYTDIDPRMKTLLLSMKRWARARNINDASKSTLSSYALTVLLISYLQKVESPPVLPFLQDLPGVPLQERNIEGWDTAFVQDRSVIAEKFEPKNQKRPDDILAGFFVYYSQFNFDSSVVNIRTRRCDKPSAKGWEKATMCVEDPFELSHNLTKGVAPRTFAVIRGEFERAARLCESIDVQLAELCGDDYYFYTT